MNQRRKGHNYERQICREFKDLGYDAKTTRQESHTLDSLGVDVLVNAPYHIQCKSTSQTFNYSKFYVDYNALDKPIIIFHKQTKKANMNFVSQGEYVIMKKELFYDLIKKI